MAVERSEPGDSLAERVTPQVVEERRAPGWRLVTSKVLHFVAAMFLLVLAIQLMKRGAQALAPRLESSGFFDNGFSTLGLGWLGSYFVLSGSPVATMALALREAGGITELQTFTMISGSRLGASFIVLLVGFLYSIKTHERKRSVGMGVLALSMSALVYLPGMVVGYGLLRSGILEGATWTVSAGVQGAIEAGWGWAVGLAADHLPGGLLFPIGLAVILVAFKLLDRVLPAIDGEKHADTKGHWLTRPWPMFFLGSLAALLTLSVSVTLTVLVPLAAKGYVNRREALPYIAGANITTLADTLLAAMLLRSASGVHVVLATTIGVTLVTVLLLAFAFQPLQRWVIGLDDWVVGTNARLWLFVGLLFLVPVALMVLGRVVGPIGP